MSYLDDGVVLPITSSVVAELRPVEDGQRRVLQVFRLRSAYDGSVIDNLADPSDLVGNYLGLEGFTSDLATAYDFRGFTGDDGADGAHGVAGGFDPPLVLAQATAAGVVAVDSATNTILGTGAVLQVRNGAGTVLTPVAGTPGEDEYSVASVAASSGTAPAHSVDSVNDRVTLAPLTAWADSVDDIVVTVTVTLGGGLGTHVFRLLYFKLKQGTVGPQGDVGHTADVALLPETRALPSALDGTGIDYTGSGFIVKAKLQATQLTPQLASDAAPSEAQFADDLDGSFKVLGAYAFPSGPNNLNNLITARDGALGNPVLNGVDLYSPGNNRFFNWDSGLEYAVINIPAAQQLADGETLILSFRAARNGTGNRYLYSVDDGDGNSNGIFNRIRMNGSGVGAGLFSWWGVGGDGEENVRDAVATDLESGAGNSGDNWLAMVLAIRKNGTTYRYRTALYDNAHSRSTNEKTRTGITTNVTRVLLGNDSSDLDSGKSWGGLISHVVIAKTSRDLTFDQMDAALPSRIQGSAPPPDGVAYVSAEGVGVALGAATIANGEVTYPDLSNYTNSGDNARVDVSVVFPGGLKVERALTVLRARRFDDTAVDDSSLEYTSGTLQAKDGGIQYRHQDNPRVFQDAVFGDKHRLTLTNRTQDADASDGRRGLNGAHQIAIGNHTHEAFYITIKQSEWDVISDAVGLVVELGPDSSDPGAEVFYFTITNATQVPLDANDAIDDDRFVTLTGFVQKRTDHDDDSPTYTGSNGDECYIGFDLGGHVHFNSDPRPENAFYAERAASGGSYSAGDIVRLTTPHNNNARVDDWTADSFPYYVVAAREAGGYWVAPLQGDIAIANLDSDAVPDSMAAGNVFYMWRDGSQPKMTRVAPFSALRDNEAWLVGKATSSTVINFTPQKHTRGVTIVDATDGLGHALRAHTHGGKLRQSVLCGPFAGFARYNGTNKGAVIDGMVCVAGNGEGFPSHPSNAQLEEDDNFLTAEADVQAENFALGGRVWLPPSNDDLGRLTPEGLLRVAQRGAGWLTADGGNAALGSLVASGTGAAAQGDSSHTPVTFSQSGDDAGRLVFSGADDLQWVDVPVTLDDGEELYVAMRYDHVGIDNTYPYLLSFDVGAGVLDIIGVHANNAPTAGWYQGGTGGGLIAAFSSISLGGAGILTCRLSRSGGTLTMLSVLREDGGTAHTGPAATITGTLAGLHIGGGVKTAGNNSFDGEIWNCCVWKSGGF